MTDKMHPVSFRGLVHWITNEFVQQEAIFGIDASHLYLKTKPAGYRFLGETLETPIGPAAGPHTQMTQNIVAAYLTGGRFFELKTVQKLDQLEIDKPCINAQDEGYNVEWSQELRLEQSYDEYVKAWFILHLLAAITGSPDRKDRGFIFNMSVGYDLQGIRTAGMDRFIEELKDASLNSCFEEYKALLKSEIASDSFSEFLSTISNRLDVKPCESQVLADYIDKISPHISDSVTLSTMHGCPPNEIEAISRYLIEQKGLHTYVKLNPTLLGFDTVRKMLDEGGYNYIVLEKDSFDHDLQYRDAVPMLKRLQEFALSHKKTFGVKLSNTLGAKNPAHLLPGDDMYMSGRSLFPLTINLAQKLSSEFNGNLRISYSGGASVYNVADILATGIYPVTVATDLLKPGGYYRLKQMAEVADKTITAPSASEEKVDLEKLTALADKAKRDSYYQKGKRQITSIKIDKPLDKFDCYIAPCKEACPIHQDVPEYSRLIEQGRYEEAFHTIISKNPLPHITGNICDHQCMFHCTRWDYDDPVLIRDLKKEAAGQAFDEYLQKIPARDVASQSGIRVAVIGAGPAGLAVAYLLARSGFKVTIYEKTASSGGTVQHVIPGFRLPDSAIDNDIDFVRRQGVEFIYRADADFSIENLKAQGYKYIFLGIGAPLSRPLRITGDRTRIHDAIDFLKGFKTKEHITLGKTVAVIGGGNSAMDGARAAMRTPGVEKVYIIYRRTREFMPADKEEFDAAIEDGVEFRELLLPAEFSNGILSCQKMELGDTGADGRRSVNPVPGSLEKLKVDSVISAIGEQVDVSLLAANHLVPEGSSSLTVNPDTNETILENVFIGGDALRGPSTVVESIADGKRAAETIIQREGLKPEPQIQEQGAGIDSLIEKHGVVLEADTHDLQKEAARCLSCDLLCNKCVEVCPNRANVPVAVNSEFNDTYQILHLDALCNECGNCETFCPYQGAPYRDKVTLYRNEADFNDSENDGFYLLNKTSGESGNAQFQVRLGEQTGVLTLDPKGKLKTSGLSNDSAVEKLGLLVRETYLNHDYLFSNLSHSQE